MTKDINKDVKGASGHLVNHDREDEWKI